MRYYGWYSNASRRKRRLGGQAAAAKAPSDEPETKADCFSRARRQNWARLLRKIYEVDPFTCPRCSGPMKIVAVIEQPETIRQIRHHLKLWEVSQRAPPIPSSGTTCPPGRIPETYGAQEAMPCLKCVLFCPHSVALLLRSCPSPTLPLLHPRNTRPSGPHGSLLAHLDPHFRTCYPQLEKQIPISPHQVIG